MLTSPAALSDIHRKIDTRERITSEDALFLWREASDKELRSLASQVRARYHSPDACTYMLMRIINYTNVCVAKCDYCSFYRLPRDPGGYLRTKEYIFAKIDELVGMGGELFAFNNVVPMVVAGALRDNIK